MRSSLSIVRCAASLAAVGAVGCGGSAGEVADGDGLVAQVKERLQSAWAYVQGQSQGQAFHQILTTGSANQYGVIRASAGSCGVTFISKHYAITASHCVAGFGGYYPNFAFEVDQILTTNLNLTALANSENISGTFPNWTSGHTLTASDGYVQTAMTCGLVFRCDSSEGATPTPNCTTAPANGANGKDIALIICPNRAATSYVKVNSGNPTSGGVVTNWFHEILNLPTSPNQADPKWVHYGCLDHNTTGCTQDSDNFHYRNVMHSQFLPLQGLTWPDGTNYAITSHDASAGQTWNNTPICHGTSGSGTFINGTSTLLGPVQSFFIGDTLCQDMPSTPHNQDSMAYGDAQYTRALESVGGVQADR